MFISLIYIVTQNLCLWYSFRSYSLFEWIELNWLDWLCIPISLLLLFNEIRIECSDCRLYHSFTRWNFFKCSTHILTVWCERWKCHIKFNQINPRESEYYEFTHPWCWQNESFCLHIQTTPLNLSQTKLNSGMHFNVLHGLIIFCIDYIFICISLYCFALY